MRPNMGKHRLAVKVFTGHACEGFAKLVAFSHVFISLFFFSLSTCVHSSNKLFKCKYSSS